MRGLRGARCLRWMRRTLFICSVSRFASSRGLASAAVTLATLSVLDMFDPSVSCAVCLSSGRDRLRSEPEHFGPFVGGSTEFGGERGQCRGAGALQSVDRVARRGVAQAVLL